MTRRKKLEVSVSQCRMLSSNALATKEAANQVATSIGSAATARKATIRRVRNDSRMPRNALPAAMIGSVPVPRVGGANDPVHATRALALRAPDQLVDQA